jgi:hypothetical protein
MRVLFAGPTGADGIEGLEREYFSLGYRTCVSGFARSR